MKRSILLVTLLLSICINPSLYAQKIKVLSGDFSFLKGQTKINVAPFDFSGAKFYNENMSEQAYLDRRKKEIEEKKPGEFEHWLKDWQYSKEESFIDKFIISANKYGDETHLQFGRGTDAPYTLIVKTTWIYPGWFAGVMNQKAKISTEIQFIATGKPDQVLLSISFDKAPGNIGMVGVPNNNDRISEGYAKTGKELAQLLDKKL